MKTKNKKKTVLKIEFDNEELMDSFCSWLSGHAEQDYWLCMQERSDDNSDYVTEFKYHDKNDKWLGDKTIRTTSGRHEGE